MNAIDVFDIKKTFRSGLFRQNRTEALRGVSLSVKSGEIFGFLGPNGAGKTTLVKILLSMVLPTSGEAQVLGIPIGSSKSRTHIGYLPENHRYPHFLSAAEFLSLSGRMHGMPEAQIKAKIDPLLEMVGLTQWKKTRIRRFSKGMAQRLGLAETLMADPHILFLDEPTDGVDPIGRKEIRDVLKNLSLQGKTIFLNSHILAEVEMICDRVAIVNKGEIIKAGTIEEMTLRKLEYEFKTDRTLDVGVLSTIRGLGITLTQDKNFVIAQLNDKNEVNKVIQIIVESGASLEGATERKSTLEDSFFELIKGGNGK